MQSPRNLQDTMNKKLLGSLSAVIAIAALVTNAAVAQAETSPHWFGNGKLIGSETVAVAGRGGIELAGGRTAFCHAKDSEVITNPPGGGPGTDEVLTFRLSVCRNSEDPEEPPFCERGYPQVAALGLPWPGHLTVTSEPKPPDQVADVFEGVSLEIRCPRTGTVYGVFSGMLEPVVRENGLAFVGIEEHEQRLGGESLILRGGLRLKGPHGDRKITAG
jgi:hypothetical protein